MAATVRPLGNNVIMLPHKLGGKLHTPDESSDFAFSLLGRVIAIGPDVTTIRVGDVVALGLSKWHRIQLIGEEYRAAPEDKIIAVIESEG